MIEQRIFRDTMGRFATGVVLVTAMDGDTPVGFAAQSFVSVSLTPPLVALCPARSSRSWPRIRAAGRFCINVLRADQRALCDAFARSGSDKYAGVSWRAAASGAPIIDDVLAWVECELEIEHDAGDHTLAIARVLDLDACAEGDPLLFYAGGYGDFAAHGA